MIITFAIAWMIIATGNTGGMGLAFFSIIADGIAWWIFLCGLSSTLDNITNKRHKNIKGRR